jgi:hypothetical protein
VLFARAAARSGPFQKIGRAAYLLRNRRTTATAPSPIASSAIVPGSGTDVPPVFIANAGSDDASIAAANISANLKVLVMGISWFRRREGAWAPRVFGRRR